jgi:hypothetical protein
MKQGLLPDQVGPLLTNAATLVAAHFKRIVTTAPKFTESAAKQLLDYFTDYMRFLGQQPALQAPQAEVRFQIGSQHVHVFFARPIEPIPAVKITVQDQTRASVTYVDELGFTVEFDPVAPSNLAFEFHTLSPESGPRRKKRKS